MYKRGDKVLYNNKEKGIVKHSQSKWSSEGQSYCVSCGRSN